MFLCDFLRLYLINATVLCGLTALYILKYKASPKRYRTFEIARQSAGEDACDGSAVYSWDFKLCFDTSHITPLSISNCTVKFCSRPHTLQLQFRWFPIDSVTSTTGIFKAIIISFSYGCEKPLFSVEEYVESDLETRC